MAAWWAFYLFLSFSSPHSKIFVVDVVIIVVGLITYSPFDILFSFLVKFIFIPFDRFNTKTEKDTSICCGNLLFMKRILGVCVDVVRGFGYNFYRVLFWICSFLNYDNDSMKWWKKRKLYVNFNKHSLGKLRQASSSSSGSKN